MNVKSIPVIGVSTSRIRSTTNPCASSEGQWCRSNPCTINCAGWQQRLIRPIVVQIEPRSAHAKRAKSKNHCLRDWNPYLQPDERAPDVLWSQLSHGTCTFRFTLWSLLYGTLWPLLYGTLWAQLSLRYLMASVYSTLWPQPSLRYLMGQLGEVLETFGQASQPQKFGKDLSVFCGPATPFSFLLSPVDLTPRPV